MEPTQRINATIPAVYVYVCMYSLRTHKKKEKKKMKHATWGHRSRDFALEFSNLCLHNVFSIFYFTFVNLVLWFFATLGSADFCWTKLSHPNLKKKKFTKIYAFWSWLRYLGDASCGCGTKRTKLLWDPLLHSRTK